VPATPPEAQPALPSDHVQLSPLPGSVVDPKLRWGVTRAFFAVAAFVLMGASIITAIIPIAGGGFAGENVSVISQLDGFSETRVITDGFSHDAITGFIIASIACCSMMIFALRKTTPVKRIGFWRESVRPFFQSIGLFLMGGSVVGLTRHWDCGEEALFGSIGGLVFGSWLFAIVSLIGRKPPKPRNFIRDDSSYAAAPPESSDIGHPADPQV